MSSRPVRKSSPFPLPRALDRSLAARPLAPSTMTRAAGSLAVAAALVLGGAAALTGCGDEKPRRDESGSSRRDRDRDPRTTDRADTNGGSALDEFVNAVGELVSPTEDGTPKRPHTEPVNDQPRPAGTMSPMSPTSAAPRLAGSTAIAPVAPPTPPKRPPTPRSAAGFGS